MDRHIIDAFLESLADDLTNRVVQRLPLRPPVKAVARERLVPTEALAAPATASPTTHSLTSLPEYLTPRQVAEVLGVSTEGLQKMRSEGRGPKFVKVGGRIRYRRSDLP